MCRCVCDFLYVWYCPFLFACICASCCAMVSLHGNIFVALCRVPGATKLKVCLTQVPFRNNSRKLNLAIPTFLVESILFQKSIIWEGDTIGMQTRNRLVVTRACIHIFSISDQCLTFRRRSCKVYVLYQFSEIFRILLPTKQIQMSSNVFNFQQIAEDRSGGGGGSSRGANGHGFYDYKRGKFVMADGRWVCQVCHCWWKVRNIFDFVFVPHNNGTKTCLGLWKERYQIWWPLSMYTLYLRISNIAKRILWRARLILPVGRASFIVSHVYTLLVAYATA